MPDTAILRFRRASAGYEKVWFADICGGNIAAVGRTDPHLAGEAQWGSVLFRRPVSRHVPTVQAHRDSVEGGQPHRPRIQFFR